jgi:hypothetical protein
MSSEARGIVGGRENNSISGSNFLVTTGNKIDPLARSGKSSADAQDFDDNFILLYRSGFHERGGFAKACGSDGLGWDEAGLY